VTPPSTEPETRTPVAERGNLPDGPKRSSWKQRLALLLFSWLLLELTSLLLFRLTEGRGFSYAELRARRARAAGSAAGASAESPAPGTPSLDPADWRSSHMLHPFVGFVRSPQPSLINDYGFYGPSPIVDGRALPRDDKHLLVAVVGGSFAAQMTMASAARLEAALAAAPRFRGREVRVFNLAMGGMKEPQQLATFAWFTSLGAEFDLVLNIDGNNELTLAQKNFELGVYPFYSGLWHFHLAQLPDPEVSRLLGRKELFDDLRRGLATRSARLAWSPLASLLWTLSDRWLATRSDLQSVAIDQRIAERATARGEKLPDFVAGPPYRGHTPEQALADFVTMWGRSSELLESFVESRGGEYHHFLQPNQYVADSKPMSEAERRIAYVDAKNRQVVAAGYPLLRTEGTRLAAQGLPFTDLTQIFRDRPEPLYVDSCCHLNVRGYDLTVDAIAAVLSESPSTRASD
jgi:hypothetical protein